MNSDAMAIDTLKQEASNWFATLRDRLCIAFEEIENEAQGPFFDEARAPGRFERSPWTRRDARGEDGGGGVMAMMRGRVFEKVGVHVSVIHGAVPPDFAGQMAAAESHPQLWAAGVSLIAHPWHPHAPTAHMNLRLVATTQTWFGGGGDLTPMLAARRSVDDPDSVKFHAAMRAACTANAPAGAYERYRAECDEYFHLAHRNESRGIGGIFFDRLWSGFPNRDFAFVKDVGEAFLGIYPAIMRNNIGKPWTEAERFEQETLRGRYAEFNLLQDRGTLFGLRTGGNIESILSSLPPRVRWP